MYSKIKKYIIKFIIILLIGSISYEIYQQIVSPKNAKTSRLECQKQAITFEKVVSPELIDIMIVKLQSQNYNLKLWSQKPKYTVSKLFNYVHLKDIQNSVEQELNKYSTKNKNQRLDNQHILIDIMVYENDINDPGKKTAKSKVYAGYIEVIIKQNKKTIYKIQADFMDKKGTDIPKRISCIVKSIMTLGDQNAK